MSGTHFKGVNDPEDPRNVVALRSARIVGSTHYRREEVRKGVFDEIRYKDGDIIKNVSRAEVEAFPDRFADPHAPKGGSVVIEAGIAGVTAKQAISLARATSDEDELTAMLASEKGRAKGARKSVVEVLEALLEAPAGDGDGGD